MGSDWEFLFSCNYNIIHDIFSLKNMIILSFNGFRTRRGRKRNLKGSFGFSYFVVILSCRNKSDRIVAVVEALSIFFL